jgi:hypothetical protein
VGTRFQFILLTGVAVEVNYFLFGFADFRHGVTIPRRTCLSMFYVSSV